MRKIIYICIVAIALLCVTACSQDFYAGLGSFMGGMGGNIYGIKPDVRKAQASADKVKGSIIYKTNEDGTIGVTIDLDKAGQILDDIDDIKKSPQRSDALREYLSAEVPGNEEEVEAVKAALVQQMNDLYDKLDEYAVEESVADVRQSLLSAIEEVQGSIYFVDESLAVSTRKPCMADIAVAGMLNKMAASLMKENVDLNEVSAVGKASADTIKIVAGIATLDVLADVNVTGLATSLTSKDIAREEEGVVNPVLANLLGKTAKKIVDLITTEREFDVNKYYTFIMESKALKAAYEMTCLKYMPEEKTILGVMLSIDPDINPGVVIDSGLTIEDFFMYIILSLNIALEEYTGGIWGLIICDYVNEGNNYAILSDLENAKEAPSSLGKSIGDVIMGIANHIKDKYNQDIEVAKNLDWDALMDEIEAKQEADPEYDTEDKLTDIIHAISGNDEYTYEDMMEKIGNSLNEAEDKLTELGRRFNRGFNNVITTSLVMLYDSEYDSLLGLLGSMIGSMFPTFEE